MRAARTRSPGWLLAVPLFAAIGGCATYQGEAETGGTPDERRNEIAMLDRQIAQAEVELGLRSAQAPPPTADMGGADASASLGMGQSPTGEEQVPEAAPPPPAPAPAQPMSPERTPATPSQQRFAEPPGAGGVSCARVCRSVSAICDASARICRLADELDDAWAAGRCQSATRSCANAESRAESSCGDCS